MCEGIPDHPRSSRGGGPPADKRRVIQGIFGMLDNGATRKDLPAVFGSKSTVHCWFTRWGDAGGFEGVMQDAGECIEERDGYKLYECFTSSEGFA